MTKDEALTLALEALETCGESEWYSDDDFGMSQIYDEYMVNKAITAIKEALAQPKERNFCPRCGKRLGKNDWDIHTCTPPQRTWVGLTDEEIDELWESTASYYNTHDFARAIEAKLKQKNGYAEEKT